MSSTAGAGGRQSVTFSEPMPSEEGVPPGAEDVPSTRLARSDSTIQREFFLTSAGLNQLVADDGYCTDPLSQDKVFRYDVVTGVWSLHFPLPKAGGGKPRGYASRSLDTRTHERPERAPVILAHLLTSTWGEGW